MGNNIIESSLVNQGWHDASSARIREPGGYSRNCCRRFKTEFVGFLESAVDEGAEEGGRLGRRGESGTAATMLNTTLLAPGSSLNSYCVLEWH